MQKQETDVARLVRQIAELGYWCFRPDIPSTPALDDAAGSALQLARKDLADLPADNIADVALKMGVLCRHLRDILNPSDDRSLWAYLCPNHVSVFPFS